MRCRCVTGTGGLSPHKHTPLFCNPRAPRAVLRSPPRAHSSPLACCHAARSRAAACQVLPQLVDYIPEAKLNLVIYYLRNDEVMEAYDLIKDMEPSIPQEYILKGVVNAW